MLDCQGLRTWDSTKVEGYKLIDLKEIGIIILRILKRLVLTRLFFCQNNSFWTNTISQPLYSFQILRVGVTTPAFGVNVIKLTCLSCLYKYWEAALFVYYKL